MGNYDKKMFKENLCDIKKLNMEEKLLMFKYYFEAYIKSIFAFGINHKITKECKSIWNDFLLILEEENSIFKFLTKNIKKIEYSEACSYLSLLDQSNTNVVEYWYSLYDDILDACEANDEYRAVHRKRDFKTLTESNELHAQAIGLIITLQDVKKFLDYPQEFWNYIEDKIVYLNSYNEEQKNMYGVELNVDDNNKLVDIKVSVPYIINLETALVNVQKFKCAYDLYKLLDTYIDNNISDTADEQLNNEFIYKYILSTYK